MEETAVRDGDGAIVRYSARLSLSPASMSAREAEAMRSAGFSDREIHDAAMVGACFAFLNRVAVGTGVTLLPVQQAKARALFGDAAVEAHLAWGGAGSGP